MKVDVSQFRKRPTFEQAANSVNKDAYKIDLPQRTYIRWQDTQARVQFENFRDATAEAEMTRIRRQAVEAQVMPPPTARLRAKGLPTTPAADQTLLTTGRPAETQEFKSKGKKGKLTVDAVMRHSSDSDDDMDPEAGPATDN